MQKYLLGTESGIQGEEPVPATGSNRKKSSGKLRRLKQARPAGDARLPHVQYLPVLRIVLPTATWYEKDDMNTSDMLRLFIRFLRRSIRRGNHAATGNLQRYRQSIFASVRGSSWQETDVVLQPLLHDSPAELSQRVKCSTGAKANAI